MLMQELSKSKERERNFEQILFTAYQFFANNMSNQRQPLMHQNQQFYGGERGHRPYSHQNSDFFIQENDEKDTPPKIRLETGRGQRKPIVSEEPKPQVKEQEESFIDPKKLVGQTPRFISSTPAAKSTSEREMEGNFRQETKSLPEHKQPSDKLTDVVPSVKDIEEADQRQERASEDGHEVIAVRQFGGEALRNFMGDQPDEQNDENLDNVERKKQEAIQRMIDLLQMEKQKIASRQDGSAQRPLRVNDALQNESKGENFVRN